MNREHRNTKWALIIVGVVLAVALVGLMCWRLAAQAHYARVKRELIAGGAKLSIEEQLPVVDPELSNGGDLLLMHIGRIPRPPSYLRYTCMELVAPGRAMVATISDPLPYELEQGVWTNNLWDVLPQHVEPGRGAWGMLKDAATNDVVAFDLDYLGEKHRLRLPHLAEMKRLFLWLRLAVALDLYAGNNLDAIDEVVAGSKLIAKWQEPEWISQIIKQALFGLHIDAIWESLQRPIWADNELRRLQTAVQQMEFAQGWCKGIQMERAMALSCFDQAMAEGRGDVQADASRVTAGVKLFESIKEGIAGGKWNEIGDASGEFVWWFAPAYYDAAHYCREKTRWLNAMRVAVETRAPSSAIYSHDAGSDWFRFTLIFSTLKRSVREKPFVYETMRSLALAAVALERYRLLSRRYPEALDELVPEILEEVPVDWFDGRPLRYRREADGRYWLWSIGKNGLDDGGVPAKAETDWLSGDDVVWPQPASEEEVARYLSKQRAKMKAASSP